MRVKTGYLHAKFLRIKARRGGKKAILAVAASAAYHMLRDGTEYNDLGAGFFDHRDPSKTIKRLLKRLDGLGYAIQPLPQTA